MPNVPFRRLFSFAVTLGVLGIVVATAIRVAGWSDGIWPVPPVIAFTVYLIPSAVALAVAALALRRFGATVVLAACAVILALVVAPRTQPKAQPVASQTELTMMSANLLHGAAEPAALAALVREHRPDVLALQELTPATAARLKRAGVFASLPHVVMKSGARWNDTGLASRFPLQQRDAGLPSVYLLADLRLRSGRTVPVISAHPTPPMNPSAQDRWVGWLRSLPAPAGPLRGALVAGDFNATLDHPEFRRLLDNGWRDAARERGQALEPTWEGAKVLRLTLDHVLVPPGAAVREFAIDRLPGSDHRVVTATVALAQDAQDAR